MVDIVLKGPGKNALGTPVMQQALEDFRAARGEPVLLRGDGDTFSAGLNLKEIAMLDPDGLTKFLSLFDELVVQILTHDAPVVACVNGHAIAGGCVLMLACDLRVAAAKPSSRIGLNEVAIGLVFPPRVLRLAESRLAPSHLSRVLLEAGLYSPAESYRLGLVHEVADDAEAASRALLAKLAESPRHAYVETKRELNRPSVELSEREVAAFRERVLPMWTSPDLRQTIAMALMKRA
ncbi:MAG: enoyl-CoA hydratase/isomerase family protein [Polyangiaceae bacterium]|nr:enoyl-CoA hydratase/isomerase family protein [Polyangiaceae bacterium]